jgi:hypothetical protein
MNPISDRRGKWESVTYWIQELTNWQTVNAKLMKENWVKPWIVLYIFAHPEVLITHLN